MKQKISSVLMVVLIIAAVFVAYVFASRVPELAATGELKDIRDYPPMHCEFITSGFDVAMSGTFYLLDGMLRSNYHYAEGRVIRLNAIIRPDATYAWEDGSSSGYYSVQDAAGSAEAEYAVIDVTTLTTSKYSKCSRWWFPDKELFIPPGNVEFVEARF